MRGIFVVGTDTGVGKTTVASGLLRLAARRGFALVPYKPVETGCDPEPADAARLAAAATHLRLAPTEICAFTFPGPVAPSVAARLAGTTITREALATRAAALAARGDALLAEGAGGLLSPFAPGLTAADLAEHFGLSILLVSANRLGTINHTALALAELARRRLPLAGLVLSTVSATITPDAAFNADEIAAHTGVRPLGTLRHCPSTDADVVADAVAADLDLRPLFEGRLVPGHC